MTLDRASLPYDPKGFPDEDEELRILKNACLDSLGRIGEELPVELLRGLHYQRAAVVGRVHLVTMAARSARLGQDERLLLSLKDRVAELERKRHGYQQAGRRVAAQARKAEGAWR